MRLGARSSVLSGWPIPTRIESEHARSNSTTQGQTDLCRRSSGAQANAGEKVLPNDLSPRVAFFFTWVPLGGNSCPTPGGQFGKLLAECLSRLVGPRLRSPFQLQRFQQLPWQCPGMMLRRAVLLVPVHQ